LSTISLTELIPKPPVLSEEQKESREIEIQLRNLIVERKLIALPANCFKFKLSPEASTKTRRYFDVTEIHSTYCDGNIATSPKITTFVVDTEKNELFEVDYIDPENFISHGEFFENSN
jgi:hypothetical protein